MIVATYHYGKTTVHIADDCIVSAEEQEKIMKRLGMSRISPETDGSRKEKEKSA